MDPSTYQSPFSWRYGSHAMRALWSDQNKRRTWRAIWVALAEVQVGYGLVSVDQAADLRRHQNDVDVSQSLQYEETLKHDLMAEIKVFQGQCPVGGGIIHLGATSMDVKDNAEVLQMRQALELVIASLTGLLGKMLTEAERYAGLICMAYTHLQPAEPTTLGYRLANHAQDFWDDLQNLQVVSRQLRGKGFKGAVGTAASYIALLGADRFDDFEGRLSAKLGLDFYPVATQTYPRKQDYRLLSALAGLAASLYKFSLDLRILQSQGMGEWSEPFGEQQVGSSAMPFKRNPIEAEKIDSLARLVAAAPMTAWQNAAHSMLERTMDDSANRRTLIPETFLAVDEMLQTTCRIINGWQIHPAAIERNLQRYAPFAAVEQVLMLLVKRGADRQEMHELLRGVSMTAWEAIEQGENNPLADLLQKDPLIQKYLPINEISAALDIQNYTGLAEERVHRLIREIHTKLNIDKTMTT